MQEVYRKKWVEMDRRLLVLIVAAVALIGVVNATVFAYRWMTGNITISGPSDATGAACTGFYSSVDQPNISDYLPPVGSNAGAPTYGNNSIRVTPSNIVCRWAVDSSEYKLYESIEVEIPVTVGSWYIQNFYGFGYYRGNGSVYVYFRVDDDAADSGILTTAYLIIRDTRVAEITRLDLKELGNLTDAIRLSPGDALRLDLYFDASSTGTVSFKVGVYVTQEADEAPAIDTSP